MSERLLENRLQPLREILRDGQLAFLSRESTREQPLRQHMAQAVREFRRVYGSRP